MKSFFPLLTLTLLSCSLIAQHKLSGTIMANEKGIANITIYLNNDQTFTQSDSKGYFKFENLEEGVYTLHIAEPDFKYIRQEVSIINNDATVTVVLEPYEQTLEEITITETQTGFGFTKLRAVENFGIYEGKKSEVIIPEQLTANLATNNARQIYSRVAGLNIWENDGAGLQLSIGGRGLDPNRTSNFNVRQNGYDISADALGYPESYYTPPTEAIGKIQIVRGAASLQYGTQFGGLINFTMRKPVENKKIELLARQTVGSFGFYNAFTSASGTIDKVSYYAFFQYKRGNGWRENSDFNNHTLFANVNYAITNKTKIGIDVTNMAYLAHQPGGLTDEMFRLDARQSNRERNWFKVDWNLFALHLNHNISPTSDINVRVFGLSANRYSVGFRPNRVATIDDNSERDLIKGDFENWGTEARYLKRYGFLHAQSVALVGGRYYHGFNHSTQGLGSTGKDADFNYIDSDNFITYDYRFPNRNASAFIENIFNLSDKFSFTPGVRFEYIRTRADGYYGNIYRDLAGNVTEITRTDEQRVNARQFLLAGVGISYKPNPKVDFYSNFSQNYRSITFSDMRIANPSSIIDPDLKDEKGYSIDVGVRSDATQNVNYDVSAFYLNYDNRIGEVQFYDEFNRVLRRRGNIGQAIISGIEAYGELNVLKALRPEIKSWDASLFNNIAFITSEYAKSEIPGVKGKRVEFIPAVNWKGGALVRYKAIKASFQYTYLSAQFTDATNAKEGGVAAVIGEIPDYAIMDFSMSYNVKRFTIEANVNNLADQRYFTRRATGYPGPGILPSDGRSFYFTLQYRAF